MTRWFPDLLPAHQVSFTRLVKPALHIVRQACRQACILLIHTTSRVLLAPRYPENRKKMPRSLKSNLRSWVRNHIWRRRQDRLSSYDIHTSMIRYTSIYNTQHNTPGDFLDTQRGKLSNAERCAYSSLQQWYAHFNSRTALLPFWGQTTWN